MKANDEQHVPGSMRNVNSTNQVHVRSVWRNTIRAVVDTLLNNGDEKLLRMRGQNRSRITGPMTSDGCGRI